jgi:hypothetical protein
VLNYLALGGLVAFSLLIVLGIYLYRKATTRRIGKPVKQPVQPKQTQPSNGLPKVQNGRKLLPDIAEKALGFLNGKTEEQPEAQPT